MTLTVIVMLFFVSLPVACTSNKEDLAEAITSRDSLPQLESHGVQSLVSDSGMIRYRITAGSWLIYDKKKPSFWSFENSLYLERFDSLLQVDAKIKADTAYFFDKDELWELRGNVNVENIKGEKFVTDLLYWNQKSERIYSDAFITICKEDQIMNGYGFESDQRLEIYEIKRTSGVFYFEDVEEELEPDSVFKTAPLDSIDK